LEFSRCILVYLHEDVSDVPDMESKPKQLRTQTDRFVLPNPRRGKNLNALRPAAFRLKNRKSEKALIQVDRTLACPEVIEERSRMAAEIHDTLAQEFAGILLHLEAANGLDGAVNASEYLTKARELAKCGLEDTRRILLGLRPKSLEGAHLCDALSQLAERFSNDCGIHCTFGASGRSHKLSEEIENELYRVTQEALCNARKHSRAGLVAILLSYRSSGVVLAIKDNGQGFRINQRQTGAQGFGLPTMCERANRLGGKMDITTGLGTGTEIRMSVPLSGKTSKE
jgi:signal transduction histidine kinase